MPPRVIDVTVLIRDQGTVGLERVIGKLRKLRSHEHVDLMTTTALANKERAAREKLGKLYYRESTLIKMLTSHRKKDNEETRRATDLIQKLDIAHTRLGRKFLRGGRQGLLGGFSGFVLLSLTGLLGQLSAAAVSVGASLTSVISVIGALGAGMTALLPITAATIGGFGVLAAVAIPAIAEITKKWAALKSAQQDVNAAKTPQEYRAALKNLQHAQKKITPDEFGLIAAARSFRQAWKDASAGARHDLLTAFTDGLKSARRLIPSVIPIVNDFAARARRSMSGAFAFLESPGGQNLLQRSAGGLPEIGEKATRAFGKLAIVLAGFTAAAAPLANWILDALNTKLGKIADDVVKGNAIDRWTKSLNKQRPLLTSIWHVLEGLGGALVTIGVAAGPLAQGVLEDIAGVFDSIAGTNRKDLTAEFNKWRAPLNAVGRLLKGLGDAIYKIADDALPYLAPMIDAITVKVLPALTSIIEKFVNVVGPKLPGFVSAIATLADQLAQPVANFAGGVLDTLTWVIEKLTAVPTGVQHGLLYGALGFFGIAAFFNSGPGKALMSIIKWTGKGTGKLLSIAFPGIKKLFGKFMDAGTTPMNPIYTFDVTSLKGTAAGGVLFKTLAARFLRIGGPLAAFAIAFDAMRGRANDRPADQSSRYDAINKLNNQLKRGKITYDQYTQKVHSLNKGLGLDPNLDMLPPDWQNKNKQYAGPSVQQRLFAFMDKLHKTGAGLDPLAATRWKAVVDDFDSDIWNNLYAKFTQIKDPKKQSQYAAYMFSYINRRSSQLTKQFGIPIPAAAAGGVFSGPYIGGEAGTEAAVPLSRMTASGVGALSAALAAYSSRTSTPPAGSVPVRTPGAKGGGGLVQIGTVNINNGMDLQQFVGMVENAIRRATAQAPFVDPSEMYAG